MEIDKEWAIDCLEHRKRFPQIFAALFYYTAGSCGFTEPHPSGDDNYMLTYMAKEPYQVRSVIDYFLTSRLHVLSFIDEQEYFEDEEERYYGTYEPASNYNVQGVLETINNYDIKLNGILFFGIDLKEIPDIIIQRFSDVEIYLINCAPMQKKELYSKLAITEITEDRFEPNGVKNITWAKRIVQGEK